MILYYIEDEEKYVIYLRTLKQALNHGLKLKEVHRVINFKQKAVYWYEHKIKKRNKKWIWKRFL